MNLIPTKISKIIFIILTIIIAIGLYTSVYYLIEIRPTVFIISSKINKNNLLRYDAYHKIAIKVFGQKKIRKNAISLLSRIESDGRPRGIWHLYGFHWDLWGSYIASEEEVFSIWLATLDYGEGRGIYEASKNLFGKEIDNLSCKEILKIFLISNSPSLYSEEPYSEKINEQVSSLENACIADETPLTLTLPLTNAKMAS